MKKNNNPKMKKSYKKLYEKCVAKAKKMMPNKMKISKTIKKARKIIERLHNIPKCRVLAENVCNFCDLLSDYFAGIYQNLPLATIVAVLGGLLYVVLPIDILADFIPVLGWLDDAAVVAFIVAAEQNDVKEYLVWKKQQITTNYNKTQLELVG